MASPQGSTFMPSSATAPHLDEQKWVVHVRASMEREIDEEDAQVPVSVFCVPRPLLSSKPEAYTPQLFALGPYHHWHPQLYEMERYKVATMRKSKRELRDIKLQELISLFIKHEHRTRSHYHRYLDMTAETLAWMMAIDASFLLEFLRNYSEDGGGGKAFRKVPSMSHMVDASRIKLAYNAILRDVVMLENQVPLFLVRKIFRHQCSSAEDTVQEFSNMLIGFVKEVSPFKSIDNLPTTVNSKQYAHLLQLIYCTIVPKEHEKCAAIEIEHHIEVPRDGKEEEEEGTEIMNPSFVKQFFNSAWEHASSLSGVIFDFLKKLLFARPLQVLVQVPWKIISSLPIISVLKEPIEGLLFKGSDEKDKDEDADSNRPPLVEEIMVPSVSELTKAGVKFSAIKGDVTQIDFIHKTATFCLPEVCLDVNTEVLLRNLVAYETSVESGPMVFTRYTELMNGIIDTDDDVKLLRESRIIMNRMKSDDEAAKMWNGMSKSVRLSRVGFIDKVLEDVNKYYNSRWSVKAERFMKQYVFGSWKILVFLAAVALLLLSCVQAFCSVYSCSARWFKVPVAATAAPTTHD